MTNDNDTAAPSTVAHSIHGSGPTLVLIHGICHSRHAWDDVLPGLVDHFRVVAIDLPGHGETPDPDSLDDEVGERMIDELAVARQIDGHHAEEIGRASCRERV